MKFFFRTYVRYEDFCQTSTELFLVYWGIHDEFRYDYIKLSCDRVSFLFSAEIMNEDIWMCGLKLNDCSLDILLSDVFPLLSPSCKSLINKFLLASFKVVLIWKMKTGSFILCLINLFLDISSDGILESKHTKKQIPVNSPGIYFTLTWSHQEKMWNLDKVINKDIRTNYNYAFNLLLKDYWMANYGKLQIFCSVVLRSIKLLLLLL